MHYVILKHIVVICFATGGSVSVSVSFFASVMCDVWTKDFYPRMLACSNGYFTVCLSERFSTIQAYIYDTAILRIRALLVELGIAWTHLELSNYRPRGTALIKSSCILRGGMRPL